MTLNEALIYMAKAFAYLCADKGISDEEAREAISIIADAAEKQVPKKPNICDEIRELWHCPVCGENYGCLKVDFCNNCGQRILWE